MATTTESAPVASASCYQYLAIVGGIVAMGVDANEIVVVAAEGFDCEIDRRTLQPFRVVEQEDARGSAAAISLTMSRVLSGAAAISNHDPGIKFVQSTAELGNQRLDMLLLVEAGDND